MDFSFFALIAAASVIGSWSMWGIAAALLHELAHVAAASACGYFPEKIRFCASGLSMTLPEHAKNTAIFAAGPAANIAAALLSLSCMPHFAAANIALAAMNLFPVPPLDGGELMMLLLGKRFSAPKAEKTGLFISVVSLTLFLTLGIYILLRSKGNFSLLAIGLWLFVMVYRNYV